MRHSYLSAALVLLPVVLGFEKRCYVCIGREGERSVELEHQFPDEKDLPVCQRGVTPPSKVCPPKYKGCLTQYNGEHVTRSCGELGLTVCQQANKIEYCYCEKDLCNKEDISKFPTPSPPTSPNEREPSDDEDLVEGSGSHESVVTTTSTKRPTYQIGLPTITPSQGSSSTSISRHFKTSFLVLQILWILLAF